MGKCEMGTFPDSPLRGQKGSDLMMHVFAEV